MINQTKKIWQLPSMSQEFLNGPQVLLTRSTVTIKYDYETSTGEYQWASMIFRGVLGFAFTTRRACSVEQIRSYDTLVELEPSDWVTELLSRWSDILERPVVHHYRITSMTSAVTR